MTQFARPTLNASVDDGITLSTKLNGALPALYTNHAGAAAPPAPEKGQVWIDTSQEAAGTPTHVMKIYTGSVWRTLGTLNLTSGSYTVAGNVPTGGGNMTGALLGFPGTVLLPGYSFDGDTNMGLYRIGADNLGFSLGGVVRGDWNATRLQMTTNMEIVRASPSITIDKASSGQTSRLLGRLASSNRWALDLGGAQADAAEAGSDFAITRANDAGTVNTTASLMIQRLTGAISFNSQMTESSQNDSWIYARASGVVEGRGITGHNPNTGTSSSYDIRFTTGAVNTWRSRIRGQREGATANGALIFSTWAGAVESDVLTLGSDKLATFSGRLDVTGTLTALAGIAFGWSGDYANRMAIGWSDVEARIPVAVNGNFVGFTPFSDNVRYFNLAAGNLNILAVGGTSWYVPVSSSDRRLKDNIKETTVDALSEILAIPLYSFDWKPNDIMGERPSQPIGFIADTLKEVASDCISSSGTYDSVDFLPLIARLTRAIQQQQETITALTSRIATLEAPK